MKLLLVVVSSFERGDASPRLVQDFGGPEGGAQGAMEAARAAVVGGPEAAGSLRRKRGRPPGSKSKPKAA